MDSTKKTKRPVVAVGKNDRGDPAQVVRWKNEGTFGPIWVDDVLRPSWVTREQAKSVASSLGVPFEEV